MGRCVWALVFAWVLPVSMAVAQPPMAGPEPGSDAANGPAPVGWTAPPQAPVQDGEMAEVGDPPFARQNRIAVSLGFAFGSIALGDFEALAADVASMGSASEPPTSGLQINVEMSARYYLPYYGLIHVGVSAMYNWAESDIGTTHKLTNDNLVLEVPILIGGYYPAWERLYVYGALGPSIAFGSRSWWDIVPRGSAPNYRSDGSVGFQVLAGADFFIGRRFALGLELRYRALESDVILWDETGTPRLGPGGRTYTMDYSGISLGLSMRLFAM